MFNNEPIKETALKDRIEKLDQEYPVGVKVDEVTKE
jgi:hypothetical protein